MLDYGYAQATSTESLKSHVYNEPVLVEAAKANIRCASFVYGCIVCARGGRQGQHPVRFLCVCIVLWVTVGCMRMSFPNQLPNPHAHRIPSINPKTTPSTAVHKPITISCASQTKKKIRYICSHIMIMQSPPDVLTPPKKTPTHPPKTHPPSAIGREAEERDLRRHLGAPQRAVRRQRRRRQLGHRRVHPDEVLPVGESRAEAGLEQRPRHWQG